MRVLVTGACGFVGRHALRELAERGHEPYATDAVLSDPLPPEAAGGTAADLRDADALDRLVSSVRPDACLHLGALSFVPSGRADPEAMLSVNIAGTIGLLDALRRHAPACRTLVVSTAQIYAPATHDAWVAEDAPPAPATLYAVSKMAADLTALGYARRFGLPVLTARPNNHTGPGQSARFAIPSWIRQIRAVRAGQTPPVIRTGNLESRRVFMDVRDVARAYRLLIEQGEAGHAYNVSASDNLVLGRILDRLCVLAEIAPRLETDADAWRPADRSPLLSTEKIRERTGWAPRIPLEQTLRDMLFESEPS